MGMCDAAGCDMADIADAMLADAAAALPGIGGGANAGSGGVGPEKADGPLTSGKVKGGASIQAHRQAAAVALLVCVPRR
jgi:hypothetical protein